VGVSRRDFLAGSAAAAAVPPFRSAPGPATEETSPVLGPGAAPLILRVDGKEIEVRAEPRTTLLEALRWQAGRSGVKQVCDRGACGACTVLLDGRPVVSCMTLAVDAAGHEVTTVHGLGTPEAPGRVQQAFIEHDAVQCGYCIPGFVTSIEAAIRRNPAADLEELKRAVAGNLCRCGTYNKVFEAALRASGHAVPAGFPELNAPACVENEAPRVDAPEKICGTAVYGADHTAPGLLFAAHVLCPWSSATLKSADLETVRRLPGVVEAEVEVGGRFEYCGAPAGHVCAESPAALRDALTALDLQWEPELVVNDPLGQHEEQFGPFPPPRESLTETEEGRRAEAALEDAAVVVEAAYATQIQNHNPLEPHGALVDPTVEPAEAWVSTQGTFTCTGLGRRLGKETVVRCEFVGGGFGSKFGPGREGALAAEIAARTGRPVRVFNDREAEQLDAGNRPGSLQWMRIGADAEGRLLGGQVYTAGIVGIGRRGGVSNPAWYDWGTIHRKHVDVRGHHSPPRAFRAPGRPQGTFACDSMMDELAEALGMDPIEIRLRNDPSEVRRAMYRTGAEAFGWEQRRPTGSQKGRLRRGMGVGVCDWGNAPGRCRVRVVARPDGSVDLYSGTQDIGQGQRTVIADLAARQLRISRERVRVHLGDSQLPNGPASGGSVTARSTAPAVMDACERLLEKFPVPLGRNGGDDAWEAACRDLPEEGLEASGRADERYWGTGGSEGVQFAEVEVDTETGVVRVLRVYALQACGLVVNRLAAENQVIGGVLQGISYALFEDRLADPVYGYQLNADLLHYKILGALDVPEITVHLWPGPEGAGVRSLGEPPTIPTSAAVGNAVANATGARVRSLPITPRRVLEALEEQA